MSELIIPSDSAEAQEIDLARPLVPMLRVAQVTPLRLMLQIHARCIVGTGIRTKRNKRRDLIAAVSLSPVEVRALREHLDEYLAQWSNPCTSRKIVYNPGNEQSEE